jgi:seryl-tRNA synthetase
VLVREPALFGTGMLPDTEQQLYTVPDDELYLAGTSEVPLASLHAGEIIGPGELPRRYAGFSTCFRREAGAAGKDTQGIFRVHQFDKVEMFSFVEPDESPAEHEEGASPRHVHTLNGTAVAVGRTIIAIAENHQRDDGSVAIPDVLHPYGAPATI